MKKSRDIKQWVFEKKKSLTEKLGHSRSDPNSSSIPDTTTKQNNSDIERKPSSSNSNITMDIDTGSGSQSKTSFVVKGGSQFRVDSRYSYVKTLGCGAYGVVCAANDAVTGKKMAVKKVSGVFDDLTDAKRIIREMRLLRTMNHDSVLKVIDIDEPENYNTFNDVYIVTELMDTDLNKLIRQSTKLLDSQRQYFAYNLFRALKYIHSANIFHRDLKPANILVSATCDIKICDFGLARYVDPVDGPANDMTEYVVTRWYRAPELLLSNDEYSSAIDMWSAGCIIAELYHGKPLFPGMDVKNQLEEICQRLGKPSSEEIASIPNRRARDFMEKMTPFQKIDMRRLMNGAKEPAIDLVERLLKFDPKKRLTAADALEHAFVAEFRDKKMESVAAAIDSDKLEPPSEKVVGREGVRKLMWNEMLYFHPDAKSREPSSARDAQAILDRVG